MSRRDEWLRTKVLAEVWRCGDDVCDCTQPRVYRVSPNHKAGYPWITRDLLWEGTFRTDGEGPTDEDLEALRAAGEQYGAENLP